MLTTYSSFVQTYGYFEMRADMPDDQGAWPAFWLLPADGTWPPELDVVEMYGQDPNTVIEGIIMEPVTHVLTVCFLSAPEKCREERLELEIQDSLTQCMFRSVMYVSNWSGQHPGLSVRKWRCEIPVASRDA